MRLLVFCEYGFSVFALWCPLATPTILLGFLLPWAWGISSRLLQQSAAIAPYLGWGVSPHHHPSWPSTWDSSSRPSCGHAATTPWTWGWSSRPPPLASGLGLLLPATAPYLRRGVAPLGHSCALSVSPTQSRVGSIIGATLTLRVKFAQDIPFVHDSQPALWNWLKVKVTQSCSTVCDPMDYTVRGILQATILDWVAFPFSRGSSQPRDRTQVSSTARGFFTSWATRGKFC